MNELNLIFSKVNYLNLLEKTKNKEISGLLGSEEAINYRINFIKEEIKNLFLNFNLENYNYITNSDKLNVINLHIIENQEFINSLEKLKIEQINLEDGKDIDKRISVYQQMINGLQQYKEALE